MIGTTQTLEVVRHSDHGLYLDAGELGTVLLPTRQVPEGIEPGEELTVFLYHDSEDRPIATLDTPKAELDQVALLSVVSVNDVGAFLDWGLQKDLFVPFREQAEEMEEIYERFGVSKKVFKKAVGQLYRKRVIVIEEDGIRLV